MYSTSGNVFRSYWNTVFQDDVGIRKVYVQIFLLYVICFLFVIEKENLIEDDVKGQENLLEVEG